MLNYQRVYVLLIGNGFYKQGLKWLKALRLNMHVRARPLFAVFVASLSCSFRRIAFWTKKRWGTLEDPSRKNQRMNLNESGGHQSSQLPWVSARQHALIEVLLCCKGSVNPMAALMLSCWFRFLWLSCSKITASAWNQLITGGPHIVDISILSYMVNPMKSH